MCTHINSLAQSPLNYEFPLRQTSIYLFVNMQVRFYSFKSTVHVCILLYMYTRATFTYVSYTVNNSDCLRPKLLLVALVIIGVVINDMDKTI